MSISALDFEPIPRVHEEVSMFEHSLNNIEATTPKKSRKYESFANYGFKDNFSR